MKYEFNGDLNLANQIAHLVVNDQVEYSNVVYDDTIHIQLIKDKLISEGNTFLQKTAEFLVFDDDVFPIVESIPVTVSNDQYVMFGYETTDEVEYLITSGRWHELISELYV